MPSFLLRETVVVVGFEDVFNNMGRPSNRRTL